MSLHLLAAGASRGLVGALQPGFTAATGTDLVAFFGAAGLIRDKVLAGDNADLIILTTALLDALAARGLLAGPVRPIGLARTGVAVPAGRPCPDIATAASLRAALLEAPALYVPDPEISTAGIHLMGVLRALGIAAVLRPALRPFPNGAAAMAHLAAAPEPGAIGCTQIPEIVDTEGLTLLGPLPAPHDLATVYAAALRAGARAQPAAEALLALLTGPASAALRQAHGFEPAAPTQQQETQRP